LGGRLSRRRTSNEAERDSGEKRGEKDATNHFSIIADGARNCGIRVDLGTNQDAQTVDVSMNPINWKLLFNLLAPVLSGLGIGDSNAAVRSQVDRLDAAYQRSYAQSRPVPSPDKQAWVHTIPANPPALKDAGFFSTVRLYANHGSDLRVPLQLRFERRSHTKSVTKAQELPAGSLVEAIIAFRDRAAAPIEVMASSVHWQLRPIRANDPNCLKCHQDVRLGDAVAVMAYGVTQRTKSR